MKEGPDIARIAALIGDPARANILGPTALGFRHRDDLVEICKILDALGVEVNLVAPLGATPQDIAKIGAADFNIVLYPEIADEAARWLGGSHGPCKLL